MNALLLALSSRCVSLPVAFCLGACAAAFANYCVDFLGWTRRYRSPWRRFPKELVDAAPRRVWSTQVPIVGWFVLARIAATSRRERTAAIPGWESKYFWIRPCLAELLFALLAAWRCNALLSDLNASSAAIHLVVELAFYWFLLCASFIDLDDYIIPDAITLSGAIFGLIAAVVVGAVFLTPTFYRIADDAWTPSIKFAVGIKIASSDGITDLVNDFPHHKTSRFVFGLCAFIWTFWSFALLDRRFYAKLGLRRAFAIFYRRLLRSPSTPRVALIWLLGILAIGFWVRSSGGLDPTARPYAMEASSLDYLVYSFIGMFVGMVLIWSVRLIGGATLGVEAMGFGDVILSGMIGTFVGWQGALVVFFLAPFFGLLFGFARRFSNVERQIPYGPFLSLAAVVYMIYRLEINEALAEWFNDPVLLLIVGGIGLIMLGVILWLLRTAKALFHSDAA
jgi:leader peptidase (prepilin peptidase)/N-methyltransferase